MCVIFLFYISRSLFSFIYNPDYDFNFLSREEKLRGGPSLNHGVKQCLFIYPCMRQPEGKTIEFDHI